MSTDVANKRSLSSSSDEERGNAPAHVDQDTIAER